MNDHEIDFNEWDEMWYCTACGRRFTLRRDARKCALMHSRPFKCRLCPETFDSANSRRNHEARHDPRISTVCPWCAEEFVWKASYFRHLRRQHPGSDAKSFFHTVFY